MNTVAMNKYTVELKKVAPIHVASIQGVVPSITHLPETFGHLYEIVESYIKLNGRAVGPPVAIYHDLGHGPLMVDMQIELAIPFEGVSIKDEQVRVYDLPGIENAACTIHTGIYEEMRGAYDAIMNWMQINEFHFAGPSREVYLSPKDGNSANYVTEVEIPVAR